MILKAEILSFIVVLLQIEMMEMNASYATIQMDNISIRIIRSRS